MSRPAPTSRQRAGLLLVVAASALGAALAPASPTANLVGDVIWLGAFGAMVALGGSRAHPAALILVAGVAGLVTAGWPLALAAGALVVGLATLHRRVPSDLGAASAALAANAIVRADSVVVSEPVALALGALAVGALLVTAHLRSRPSTRRVVRRLGGVVGLVCLLSIVLGAGAALLARGDLEAGVTAARQGLDLATDADTEAARARFIDADRRMRTGHRHLTRPWALPARALPVVGPNLTAVVELADAGSALAASAVAVADAADPSRLIDGARIDLAVLAETTPRLHAARDSLEAATTTAEGLRSPWLIRPVTDRLDMLDEMVEDAMPRLDSLMRVTEVLPSMLGADAPRNYLLLFTTPSETRGIGGFVGNWAILEVDEGRIELGERGRAADMGGMRGAEDRVISGPQEYLDRYYRYYVHRFPVNVTASPDFPTVARVASELFPQARVPEFEGVILVDPSTLAALLDVTGPIEVTDIGQTFTSDTLEQFLWLDQYRAFDTTLDRKESLDDLVDVMFERLTSGDLDPKGLIDSLGPMVEARRLMIWSSVAHEAEVLRELGIDGAFPRPDPGQDLVSIRTANANGNKIDVFLERHVSYEATVDPETGTLRARLTVALHNSAFDDPELPNYVLGNFDPELERGWNRQWVSLYTPHRLIALEADGEPVEPETIPELGVLTHALYVDVPPGGTVTITFELEGDVEPERYSLVWSGQPTIHPDVIDVRVDTGRETLTHEDVTSGTFTLAERHR